MFKTALNVGGWGGGLNWKFPLCVVDKCLTEKINSFPTYLKFILRSDNGNMCSKDVTFYLQGVPINMGLQ